MRLKKVDILDPTGIPKTFKIGYWNINKKDGDYIVPFILDLLIEKDLDLLFLSEFQNAETEIINRIPAGYSLIKHSPICKKVLAIQKDILDFSTLTEEDRYILVFSKTHDLLIVGLHLQSDTNDSKNSSRERTKTLNSIMEAARRVGSENEVFVGDYNCMPFAEELTDFDGMHSVLFKGEMKTNANSKPKHYNPILLRLNEDDKTYGSFRYTANNYSYYWYAFDQVIVSEALVDSVFDIEYLKELGKKSLMSPNKVNPMVSDHLPLTFSIRK